MAQNRIVAYKILFDCEKVGDKIQKGFLIAHIPYNSGSSDRIFHEARKYYYIGKIFLWETRDHFTYEDFQIMSAESMADESHHTYFLTEGGFTDFDLFRPAEHQKIYDVVCIASWAKFKNLDLLIQSIRYINQRLNRKVKCLIISYHTEFHGENVRSQILKTLENGPDIVVQEDLTREQMVELINKSRLGIILSTMEGTNRAKVECMACNIPFIVRKDACDSLKMWINEKTGLLCGNTPEEIAADILCVLDNIKSYAPREGLLEQGAGLKAFEKRARGIYSSFLRRDGFEPDNRPMHYFNGRSESFDYLPDSGSIPVKCEPV